MATNSDIKTFLDTAKAAGISSADMVTALDYAILTQIVDGDGKYVVNATDDDTSLSVSSMADMIKLRDYYEKIGGAQYSRDRVEMGF